MKLNSLMAADPPAAARIYVDALRKQFPRADARLKSALKFHLDCYQHQTDKEEWRSEARLSFESKVRQTYPFIEVYDWPAWPRVESLTYEILASEEAWPHHKALGDLLACISDQTFALNEVAHRLTALLHGGLEPEQAEQCRSDWCQSRAQLDAFWGELDALAATVGAGQIIPMPRDAALDEELRQMVAFLRNHRAARDLEVANCPRTLRNTMGSLQARASNAVWEANVEAWIDDWLANHVGDALGVRSDLKALRASLERLCTCPLEDELIAIFAEYKRPRCGEDAEDSNERMREMFFQRKGWNGEPKCTLSNLSQQWGISRERVRQIVGPVENWISERRLFTPVLERALEIVGENLPARADELALLLQRCGATRELWSLQALAETAQSLGRKPEFVCAPLPDVEADKPTILVWGAETFAGEIANKELSQRLWHKVNRHVWESGIGYLPDLQDEISNAEGDEASALAEILLRCHPCVRWSEQEPDWFWLQGAREMHNQENRLFTPMERALSVARRLSLPRFYAAATRFYLHSQRSYRRWEMPPQPVFEEWCAEQDQFIIENGIVEMQNLPHWRDFLENTEAMLIEILDEHGPLLSRWKFYQLALENGITQSTFYRYVDELSTIEEFDEGLFALVGAEISAAQIQKLREDYSNFCRKFYLRYGRLDDGRIWMSHRLSAGRINSGSLNLPTPMRGSIEGRYQLLTPEIAFVGTLAFNFNQCWGLRKYLANHASARDRATLILDQSRRHAIVYLGLEGLPEEIVREVEGLDNENGDEDDEI